VSTLERMTVVALGSLGILVACLLLYSYRFPLPSTGVVWSAPGTWVSVLLLATGLTASVLLMVAGLVSLLNWLGSEPAPAGKRERP
jgi:hypothetical protein